MTDLIRALIDFDPRRSDTYKFASVEDVAIPRLSPIPWPDGLGPQTQDVSGYSAEDALPEADVLVVTYTQAEGVALADVLSPGLDTDNWVPYRNGWDALKAQIVGDRAPSLEAGCAGRWALTSIGSKGGAKRVVLFKSNLHPSTDGHNLPMVALWKQLVAQVQPRYVVTTGTAGGIGADAQLGDVVLSSSVRWDCQRQFKNEPWAHAVYQCPIVLDATSLPDPAPLFAANAARLASQRKGTPQVWKGADVITTDFFAMDTADDHFGLRALDSAARAVEMDDAACALALEPVHDTSPWIAIRNASDAQLAGSDIQVEEKQAASVYERFGYWTTVNSAIVCWSFIVAMD